MGGIIMGLDPFPMEDHVGVNIKITSEKGTLPKLRTYAEAVRSKI